MGIRRSVIIAIVAQCVSLSLEAQTNLLSNGQFEMGEKTPAGWSLNKDGGDWVRDGGIEGGACVSVSGDGASDNAWLSEPVTFLPNHLYRFSVMARSEEAGGGTAVCGPSFANVDLGVPGKTWGLYEHVFATPVRRETPLTSPVRLGQWQMKGRVFFDAVRLAPVQAVHAPLGEAALGDGERRDGRRYLFDALLGGEGRNHSRPLLAFNAGFNTDRWCFGDGSFVTYRHDGGGQPMLNGSLEVSSGYHVSGRLAIDASKDGKEWEHIGHLTNSGSVKIDLPAALFPAEMLWVRLRGAKPPCNLQVNGYHFEGDVAGEPVTLTGSTRYIETESRDPRVRVLVRGLGEALPGGANQVELRVQNASGAAMDTQARVIFSRPGETPHTHAVAVSLPRGPADVQIPYEMPGVGRWQMAVEVGDAFTAHSSVYVPEFYDDCYGELLPVSHPALNLWRASSGWKIPEYRALPRQIAKALSLRLAANEQEAVQLVVAPNAALTNATVSVSELRLGQHVIDASQIQVLRVGYVPVTRRTDRTGTLANWPDPLLPQTAATILAAGRHHPYWIRVKVPRRTEPGIYRGTVTVQADGVSVSVGLNVEVYGFALPDTLTCETAFGFNPSTVWRYHGVREQEQRRAVLDAYLRTLGEYGISIYNPAPMDGWSVRWKGMNPWQGGRIVTDVKIEGQGSLMLVDDSPTHNVSAQYSQAVTVPAKGFRIAFKHRTDVPHPFLFSIARATGQRNT